MRSLDKTSRKNFPWIIFLATLVAVTLVILFQDPLSYIRDLLSENNLFLSWTIYTVVLAISVVVSRFSIAPAVPFVAKVLSPEITFVLTVFGWTIGSMVAFALARFGEEATVGHVYPIRTVTQNQYQLHSEPTFITLFQTRLFAALDNLSYFVGLKTVTSFTTFLLVTLAGSIPAAFIFSFSADAIADGEKITLFGLFFAVSLIGLAYLSHKGWSLFEKPAHIYTTQGTFSAGEIVATAALIIFCKNRNKPYRINRVSRTADIIEKKRKQKKKKEWYVCDTYKKADERENVFGAVEAGVRGNNIPYGVLGLVWRKYGQAICGSEAVAQKILQEVILGIDAEDSGIRHEEQSTLYVDQWSLSEILEKTYGGQEGVSEIKDVDHESFMKAVEFAEDFLERIILKKTEVHI